MQRTCTIGGDAVVRICCTDHSIDVAFHVLMLAQSIVLAAEIVGYGNWLVLAGGAHRRRIHSVLFEPAFSIWTQMEIEWRLFRLWRVYTVDIAFRQKHS